MLHQEEMPARVLAFLKKVEPSWNNVVIDKYEVMTGGYSRLLARVDLHHDGESATLVLRGDPPADRSLITTDRRQEHDLLLAVGSAGVRTPRALYFDPTGEDLGTVAIVLEFSKATSFMPYVAAGNSIEGLNVRLAEAIASYQSIPLDSLPQSMERPASWDAYMTKRINLWREASNNHVESLPIFHYVAEWLDAHRPPAAPLVLMHGDFQCANVMVTNDGHFEIIDWELAGIGDPREDMGYFKAVSQAAPPDLLDDAGIEAFCARYRELTGLNELQVNPATVAYFLVLGVVGTVEQLMHGGAAWAKGENHLFNSVFNMSSVLFGQSMWLDFLGQLSEPLKQLAAASKKGAN